MANGVDYIAKPISPAILRARIHTHLTLKNSADLLKNQNQFLENEVAKRTREVLAEELKDHPRFCHFLETRPSN